MNDDEAKRALREYAIAWLRKDNVTCKELVKKYPEIPFESYIKDLLDEYSIE